MIKLDDGLGKAFLAECGEELVTLETELLALEKGGAEVDVERANRAYRLIHSIRGGAYFLDLGKVGDLAHRTEDMLGLIRSRKMAPSPERFNVLLQATDMLHEMIRSPATSGEADISDIVSALARLPEDNPAPRVKRPAPPVAAKTHQGQRRLRVLLVEDDFTSRLVLQTFLSRYGECHVAVNGREAVDACRAAFERGQIYDLICMDIMMPEMDGREAVRQVRALEESHGVVPSQGAKITMTTTVADIKKVFQCFKELCDAYLIKPIDLAKLLGYMESWGMVGQREPASGAVRVAS